MATVGEILNSVIPRLPEAKMGISFLNAMQTTVDVIVRRLWLKRSDLLKATISPITVAADASTFNLPSDFLGFAEAPYVTYDESTTQLRPLPPNTRNNFTVSGKPQYYDIAGSVVTLFPTPDKEVTISGVYFQDPAKLTAMSSTVPFSGLFDPILKDAVLQIGSQGIFIINTPQFEAMVRNHVDQVLQGRNPKNVGFFQERTGNQPWRGF